jgi:hypothetical protein
MEFLALTRIGDILRHAVQDEGSHTFFHQARRERLDSYPTLDSRYSQVSSVSNDEM